jgi:ABC-type multidrug transport system ATPase subunit
VRQSVDHGKTVIVTTHYIEEAKQSHTVIFEKGNMKPVIILS